MKLRGYHCEETPLKTEKQKNFIFFFPFRKKTKAFVSQRYFIN